MKVELVREPIDYGALVESIRSTRSGAVVLFLGTVREMSDGKSVDGLTYDAYASMAEAKLQEIVEEAVGRWSLDDAVVVHRWGSLELGEIAVAVVTASGHRAAAFASAGWIMDTIKRVAPIWKREHWREGSATWVHPADAERPDLTDA